MNTHSNSKIFGKVAVITRTKNRNILLPRAINSVLSQTSPEWVHVIINDGGDTEELESTILPFRENRVVKVKSILSQIHIIVSYNWKNHRNRFIGIQFGLEDLFRVLIISTCLNKT